MPAPQVTPWTSPFAPSSTPTSTRSQAAISHSTFMWMRPSPPLTSRAMRAWLMAPRME
ncbi:hypothetical protein HRbin39_00488 [bacterium HR39]|nr:hypothetical protein HRbin39_00488 [bacterium HR39]